MRSILALLPLLLVAGPLSAVAQSMRGQAPALYSTTQEIIALQTAAESYGSPDSASTAAISFGSWVTPTKWVTLGSSVALAVLGFTWSEQADDAFQELIQLCNLDPDNCRDRNPDGSYTDPVLEELFATATSKDDQAQAALIASTALFAGSVALFIIDFQGGRSPGDIPYHPEEEEERALRLSVTPGEISLRLFID